MQIRRQRILPLPGQSQFIVLFGSLWICMQKLWICMQKLWVCIWLVITMNAAWLYFSGWLTIKWGNQGFLQYSLHYVNITWVDIFLHFQILQEVLVKYLYSSSFQISNKYWLHSKHGSTKSFLNCISKTYTYKCQDCSTIRKTMAFIYAWRLVTFKKFQTSPKQQECSTSESRIKNIPYFALNCTLDRLIRLLFPFAQNKHFWFVYSDYQCQLSRL